MAGDFRFGAIVAWDDFKFEDGGSSDKLLIILGAKTGHDVIAVLTTSKSPPKNLSPGCHAEPCPKERLAEARQQKKEPDDTANIGPETT